MMSVPFFQSATSRALFICVAATAALHGQGAYLRTDLVVAYASVRDADRRFISNLTKEDFEIVDEGSRREITAFAGGDADPISVAVLLEHESMYARGGALMRDVDAFKAGLKVDDLAGMSTLIGAARPVSKNRQGLFNGQLINADMILSPISIWDGLDRSLTSLGRETTRRAVLVLSGETRDGGQPMFPVDGSEPLPASKPARSVVNANDVARRVGREGVIVYSLSLEGSNADRRLKNLASTSGGNVINLRREQALGLVLADLVDELRHLYVLGFVPGKSDGKEHKVQIRVRTPGSVVRATQAYVAPRPNR